jgi:hypothetical protein
MSLRRVYGERVGCQKCMFGIVMDDDEGVLHYFRFSVTHFGIRTAGNLFHALVTPLIRKYRRKGVCLIIWVDDVLIIVPTTYTRPLQCGGGPQCEACQSWKEIRLAGCAMTGDRHIGGLH